MASSTLPQNCSSNDESFDKSRRLLNSASFQPVFSTTEFRASCPEFLVLAKYREDQKIKSTQHARLGMVIAKKHIRHAVNRNKTKRVIRECFRKNRHRLYSLDIVVLARANAGNMTRIECSNKILKLFVTVSDKASRIKSKS